MHVASRIELPMILISMLTETCLPRFDDSSIDVSKEAISEYSSPCPFVTVIPGILLPVRYYLIFLSEDSGVEYDNLRYPCTRVWI